MQRNQDRLKPAPLADSLLDGERGGVPYVARRSHQSSKVRVALICLLCYSFFVSLINLGRGLKDDGNAVETYANGKKNIIMMVTDGTGPSSINMARYFRQYRDSLDIEDVLTLDRYFIGSSRTRSASSLITDSAAGATAFSCALKSYNGAIGVDGNKQPCGTILEALKLKGYKTGLVVTTGITDATPASFNAHADYRFMQSLIANQQLGLDTTLGPVTDLMIGGGSCFYLPRSHPQGCRDDETNLLEKAKEMNYTVVTNRQEFDQLQLGNNASLPLLALVAYYNIPYDLDREETEYPSLEEEVKTALRLLTDATKDSDEGFFLLIEGSRIDHAGHSNDPAAQVREVLAYDKAFKAVIDYIDSAETETFMVSTSDHETGGLAVGRQVGPGYPEYLWKPEVLLNATKSGEYLRKKFQNFRELNSEKHKLEQFIKTEILENDLGIADYTDKEVFRLLEHQEKIHDLLVEMVSVRAEVGWSTHGHTAVDVNIYAHSNTERGRHLLRQHLAGNVENTDIGRFWEQVTNSDLAHVTHLLRGTKHVPTAADQQESAHIYEKEHGFIDHRAEAPEQPL
ncbi:hypothetical protein KL905_001947 [Ogataea polymorpha]|uniref:Alkaline phosphatase n=2 Tax=Ogataea polymorpha TaxID=460523 RepID=A0A9P8P3X6_9ASCO|nr:hypothetical protein KL907_001996 [Ogataea polymorpha]KAG7922726.1 hypothetical protein KL905_001947 [Ogataea polymorpha]KAH3664601.1 hypothetical protein OGATHE_003416 [Ogataea polymorpha]